jgi:hypothetical protein
MIVVATGRVRDHQIGKGLIDQTGMIGNLGSRRRGLQILPIGAQVPVQPVRSIFHHHPWHHQWCHLLVAVVIVLHELMTLVFLTVYTK